MWNITNKTKKQMEKKNKREGQNKKWTLEYRE